MSICLLISICITIFLFSASPADISQKHSGKTGVVVKVIYGEPDNYPAEEHAKTYGRAHLIVRKAAHFSIYLALWFCAFGFACTFNIRKILMVAHLALAHFTPQATNHAKPLSRGDMAPLLM